MRHIDRVAGAEQDSPATAAGVAATTDAAAAAAAAADADRGRRGTRRIRRTVRAARGFVPSRDWMIITVIVIVTVLVAALGYSIEEALAVTVAAGLAARELANRLL